MVARGGLTNRLGKKRSERQRRNGKICPSECRGHGKICPSECRVPKYSKERCKKGFLSKEIEENCRIEKTRGLVKKIGDAKGTFHAKRWAHKGKK